MARLQITSPESNGWPCKPCMVHTLRYFLDGQEITNSLKRISLDWRPGYLAVVQLEIALSDVDIAADVLIATKTVPWWRRLFSWKSGP